MDKFSGSPAETLYVVRVVYSDGGIGEDRNFQTLAAALSAAGATVAPSLAAVVVERVQYEANKMRGRWLILHESGNADALFLYRGEAIDSQATS